MPQILPSQLRVKESFGSEGAGERAVTLCELDSDYTNASQAVAVRAAGATKACLTSGDMDDETKLLASLKHPNIVKLLGMTPSAPTSRACSVLEHSNQGANLTVLFFIFF